MHEAGTLDLLAAIAQLPRSMLARAWRPHTAHPSTAAALVLSLIITDHSVTSPSKDVGHLSSTTAPSQRASDVAAAGAGPSSIPGQVQQSVPAEAAPSPAPEQRITVTVEQNEAVAAAAAAKLLEGGQEAAEMASSTGCPDPGARRLQRLVPVLCATLGPLALALQEADGKGSAEPQPTDSDASAAAQEQEDKPVTANNSESMQGNDEQPERHVSSLGHQQPAPDASTADTKQPISASDQVLRTVAHPADVCAALAAAWLVIALWFRSHAGLGPAACDLQQQAACISHALAGLMGGAPSVTRSTWRAALMRYGVCGAAAQVCVWAIFCVLL